MLITFLVLLVLIVMGLSLFRRDSGPRPAREHERPVDWEYGEVWKTATPEGSREEVAYVEILRTDTGHGYDDTAMMDLVGYLGSRGIRATYDSFSLGLEPAAIKTYVLKAEEGKEREALDYLNERKSEVS
jgi:hypothetical protein